MLLAVHKRVVLNVYRYRKIPGDICSGGVDLNGQIVNLTAHCANNRDFIWKEEAVVVICLILLNTCEREKCKITEQVGKRVIECACRGMSK